MAVEVVKRWFYRRFGAPRILKMPPTHGVAMGAAGMDAAIEAADIALV